MKKIRSLFFTFTFWVLISTLSACSYHSVQPEDIPSHAQDSDLQVPTEEAFEQQSDVKEQQKTDAKEQQKTDAKEHESMSVVNAREESAQRSAKKQIESHQAENESAKAASKDRTTLMSEDELESITGSTSFQNKKKTSPTGSTEASEKALNISEADETTGKTDTMESGSSQLESEDEEAKQTSSQSIKQEQAQVPEEKESDLNEQHKVEESTDTSEFILMPEELDDGSEGELQRSENVPRIADEEKQGNSNINRKGQDTHLMKEGKIKRAWNLQRQL